MKTYATLDNGGEPFLVRVSDANVTVYRNDTENGAPPGAMKVAGQELLTLQNVSRVFIGWDPPGVIYNDTGRSRYPGNSILVNTAGNEYYFIGDRVTVFKTKDLKDVLGHRSFLLFLGTHGNTYDPNR